MVSLFKFIQYIVVGTLFGVIGAVGCFYFFGAVAGGLFGASDNAVVTTGLIAGGLSLLWGVGLGFNWYGQWKSDQTGLERARAAVLHYRGAK